MTTILILAYLFGMIAASVGLYHMPNMDDSDMEIVLLFGLFWILFIPLAGLILTLIGLLRLTKEWMNG